MSGTRVGGEKARDTNKERYGKDYYAKIGGLGGKKSRGGGFAYNSEMARLAGKLGGLKSSKSDDDFKANQEAIKEVKKEIAELKKRYSKDN